MVDLEKRAQLREALTQLVNGAITNDQFNDLSRNWECADRAVQSIGDYFVELCSDDRECRFIGPDALDADTRERADRCILFLRTDREYEWPDAPSTAVPAAAGGAAVFLVLPLGVALLIAAVVFRELGLLLAGLACLGLSGAGYWWWSHREDAPEWRAYWASGEREAWPFLNRADGEQALRNLARGAAPSVS